MSSKARSRPLAIATVVGTVATLGYMYVAGAQSKDAQGQESIYKTRPDSGELRGATGGSDARMGSSAVRAAVQGDKK